MYGSPKFASKIRKSNTTGRSVWERFCSACDLKRSSGKRLAAVWGSARDASAVIIDQSQCAFHESQPLHGAQQRETRGILRQIPTLFFTLR